MGHLHQEENAAARNPESVHKGSSDSRSNHSTWNPSAATAVKAGESLFRIGIVIHSDQTTDRHIGSICKPASTCSLTRVVVLNSKNHMTNNDHSENHDDNKKEDVQFLSKWLQKNHFVDGPGGVTVGHGREGFNQLLLEPQVDAVYIIVPHGSQRDYVLAALAAGKHVLLNDPLSTSLSEFKEQQESAKLHGKFIQFSTMFVHQHRVRKFMDRVLYDEGFGRIHSIHSHVRLSYDDIEKVGVQLPLLISEPTNGNCIRVVGRFCVLLTTLFFSRNGCFAKSAQVRKIETTSNGLVASAECIVNYSEGKQLVFDVGYTKGSTRQSIELHASSRYGVMKDFIIDHPDGLATYRVYEKASLSSSTLSRSDQGLNVLTGEAIDVDGGPTQELMMWRTFVRCCQSLDKQGGWGLDKSNDETSECRELANVALQTKRILIALVKSSENGYKEVIIDDIDYQ